MSCVVSTSSCSLKNESASSLTLRHSMVASSSLLLFVRELGSEQRTAAVQSRHHGSQWNIERLGNLLVGHLFHVAQHDHLLVLVGDASQCGEQIVVGQLLRNRRDECSVRRDAIVDVRHE